MKRMTSAEAREMFLRYFEERGHQRVASSSLIPHNDPTLLFTNAGMNQFKEVFLGLDERPYRRAATSQKCVRAGGKHNDLENVGRTARHNTFFEMLGNFSFGDYFKEEAIAFAWELLTDVFGFPKDQLYATIHHTDDQSYEIWQRVAGLPEDRIIRLGDKDNFWQMADTGPCGPCTEIIYDRGDQYRCEAEACAIGGCDCDRWLEVWNNVFMQYDRDEDGDLNPLPRPCVDTGMSLGRLCSVLQDVYSVFDTDLFTPIIRRTEDLADKEYTDDESGMAFRVIADHARACTFLIADGVMPSNEGRGYVLRRILRRAVRFGKSLGIDEPFMDELVDTIGEIMGDAYPDTVEKADFIKQVIQAEEERFHRTLDEGMRIAGQIIDKVREDGGNQIPGSDAFLLYDTFGFPIDLTEDVAEETGLSVDREGFEAAMADQRQRAREAREDIGAFDRQARLSEVLDGLPPTEFTGYEGLETPATTLRLVAGNEEWRAVRTTSEAGGDGTQVYLLADRSPFYVEGGGQVSDEGTVAVSGEATFEVKAVEALPDGKILHSLGRRLAGDGPLQEGDGIVLRVKDTRRLDIARNHTATHLLHKALNEVLGEHVNQSGSLVSPERLRFDFSHFQALTPGEVEEIEDRVNAAIMANLRVDTTMTTYEKAKEMGAVALFGERYGDEVRVVAIDDYSKELCGGTHVRQTGEIGSFRIVAEASVGAGLRRIEAVTGRYAIEQARQLELTVAQVAAELRTKPEDIVNRVVELQSRLRERERQIGSFKDRLGGNLAQDLAASATDVGGVPVIAREVSVPDMDALRSLGDKVKNIIDSGVIVLGARSDGKVQLVALVTGDLIARGLQAGKLVGEVAKACGGGGGGRPDMAQAGGRKPEKLEEALSNVSNLVVATLK